MAQLIINIPDAQLPRTLNGLGEFFGYTANIQQSDGTTIPNPESRTNFIRRMLTIYIKEAVLRGEAGLAYKTAQSSTPPDITVS
jgi:hypothetical protein